MKDHTFTLGIEEEFAIIDPETRELRSHIHEILEGGKITLKEQIKTAVAVLFMAPTSFLLMRKRRQISSPSRRFHQPLYTYRE